MRQSRMLQGTSTNSVGHVGPPAPHSSELKEPTERHESQFISDTSLGRWDAFESKYITPVFTRTSSNKEDQKKSEIKDANAKAHRTSIISETVVKALRRGSED